MASRRKPTAAVSASEKNTKRPKRSNNGQEDLISELPDSILHHILSFLDMKYVIPTSLLSRRWRYLWRSLPFLNISDEVYNHCKKPVEEQEPLEYDEYEEEREVKNTDFTDFVDGVLLMRDRSSDISSCRFSYNESDIDEKKILGDIYLWIHVLIRCNVKFFDFCIGSLPEQINLPHCLFNCKSLTTLKLDMGLVDVDNLQQPKFNLPTELGMNLPALRVLQLRFLSIAGDVGKLISSCPVLETFIISKCVVNLCGRQLNISASQLKKLVIDEIGDDRSVTESLCYCKVKVFAPKLTSFMCRGTPINDYSFVDISSIVNAEIETNEYAWRNYFCDDGREYGWRITWKQDYLKHLLNCLGGIYNVRSLTLSAWLLTVITEAHADFRSLPMDPYCNLRLLNLKTSLSRREIHSITSLLEKCPNLETLVLKMVEYEGLRSVSRKEFFWEKKLEPQCMMDHLKLVEIWDILTSVNELEFLKFLLKNATVLEKMIVHTPKKNPVSDNIKLKRFCEKLKTFPAASLMTGISFLSDAEPREPDADLPIGRLIVYGDILSSANALDFLKFLMTNAAILEKVIVNPSKQFSKNEKELKKFVEKLTTFPATSSRIEILFE